MQNMVVIDDKTLQTPYGIVGAVNRFDTYQSGELRSVVLGGENVILTHAGELIPYYTETSRRKYKPSIDFFKNGMIKAVALETQQELLTPIGEIPSELITFYDTGEVRRIFPLDGKITGFWTEEEEKELNIPFSFDLGFTKFTAMLNSISFYKSGDIRSITLYPGESILVNHLQVKNGFSLYESGELESLEPLVPVEFKTKIGKITAFDNESLGVTADSNSVNYYKNGELKSLITVDNKVQVQDEKGILRCYEPEVIEPVIDGENETILGLKIHFHEEGVSFGIEEKVYDYSECGFTVLKIDTSNQWQCSSSDCSQCSLCSK